MPNKSVYISWRCCCTTATHKYTCTGHIAANHTTHVDAILTNEDALLMDVVDAIPTSKQRHLFKPAPSMLQAHIQAWPGYFCKEGISPPQALQKMLIAH